MKAGCTPQQWITGQRPGALVVAAISIGRAIGRPPAAGDRPDSSFNSIPSAFIYSYLRKILSLVVARLVIRSAKAEPQA
jgi:hypothetical protein